MTTDPTPAQAKRDRRRRRREDLVRPLGLALAGAVVVIIVLTYAVSVLKERQDRINEIAVTAQTAAVEAKAATSRTRVIAVDNAANARAAKLLADQLNRAVCNWRADLQRRYHTTAEYLRDNPAGFPGVPLKTLTDGQKNLRRTIKSFRGLSCPK